MRRRDFSWDCADCGFNGQLQQGFTIGGMGPDCHFAWQQSSGLNVRFGSKADIDPPPANVRFTPKSRHWNSVARCLLCAKSRLSALQQRLALFGMFDLAQIAVGQHIVRKAEDEARGMACYNQQRFLRRSEASNSSIFVLRHLLVANANPLTTSPVYYL